jgi:hypothetical protein
MTTHENLEKFKECPDDLPKLPPSLGAPRMEISCITSAAHTLVLKNQAGTLCFSKMRKNEASFTQQVILCLATNFASGKNKFPHTLTPKI